MWKMKESWYWSWWRLRFWKQNFYFFQTPNSIVDVYYYHYQLLNLIPDSVLQIVALYGPKKLSAHKLHWTPVEL